MSAYKLTTIHFAAGIPVFYFVLLRSHLSSIDPDIDNRGTKGRMDVSRNDMVRAVEIREGNVQLRPFHFLFESCKSHFSKRRWSCLHLQSHDQYTCACMRLRMLTTDEPEFW